MYHTSLKQKEMRFIVFVCSFLLSFESVSFAQSVQLPIVFVHGMLASGDTYAGQITRFEMTGYDHRLLHTFDWNSLGFGRGGAVDDMDKFVDSILKVSGREKLYLVGHSAGSGLVYNFCKDSVRSRKIAGVVLIGGFKQEKPAGHNNDLPTLNIYSEGDLVARNAGDIPGATNLRLISEDHYEVATGMNAFKAMHRFILGSEPSALILNAASEKVVVSGKAVELGSNDPIANGSVQIYKVNSGDGQRISEAPDFDFTVNNMGHWGPAALEATSHYEFVVKGPDTSDTPIHYFREQISSVNRNVYLRSIPNSGLLSMMFSGLPSDSFPALAVFSSTKAILNGRDTLIVDGTQLTNTDFFKPSRTTIAMFLYDGNTRGKSDLTGVGLFNMQGVFLAGIDMFVEATKSPLKLQLNDRTLNVRRIPSKMGIVVPVFD